MSKHEHRNREAYFLLAGKLIGTGAYRKVYECGINPDLVVKVETGGKDFSNSREYYLWVELKGTPLEKWLAPVVAISPAGGVMLQKRTTPIHDKRELPKSVPELFGDLHIRNWGRLNGRVVCHDYGEFRAIAAGKMRKADW